VKSNLDYIITRRGYYALCKKVVSWDAALLWIGGHKNCPHCRCDANFDNKYINAQKPDVIKKKQKKQKKIVNGANRITNKYQSQQYQKNIKAQFKNGRY
jgi:hypothetical protein